MNVKNLWLPIIVVFIVHGRDIGKSVLVYSQSLMIFRTSEYSEPIILIILTYKL